MLKRICRFVSTSLLACSVLLLLAVTVPRAFGVVPYCVASGSMEPAIPTGSLVLVDTGDTSPKVGEVVAFDATGKTVTHRVAAITDMGYVTKGDANAVEDPNLLLPDRVIGTYVAHVPLAGFLFLEPGPRIAWIALLVVATFLPVAPKTNESNGKENSKSETTQA